MTSALMTRKDCIRVTESFARSGFKGVSVSRGHEATMLSAALRLKSEAKGCERESDPSEQRDFLQRNATRTELSDANKLVEAIFKSGLCPRTLKVIYLRSFHQASYKSIAARLSMDRLQVKHTYEDGLYILWERGRVREIYGQLAA